MDKRTLKVCILAAAILCGRNFPIQAQTPSPPANDDYESRLQLPTSSTDFTFSGTTVGATVQTNELVSEFLQGITVPPTVWWEWTPSNSTDCSIDLLSFTDRRFQSSLAWIAVWTNVDWANRTGDNPIGTRLDIVGHPHFSFHATAGVTYGIQVAAPPYGSFTLRVIQTNAPIIYVPPRDRLVSPGDSTFFGVIAGGTGPSAYQWRFNGRDIPQQTWPILSLDNIDATMAGSYTVVVSNNVAAVESLAGVVTIRTNDLQPVLGNFAMGVSNTISIQLSGEPLTSYRIESSSNLIDWHSETSFPLPIPYNTGYLYDPPILPMTSVVHNEGPDVNVSIPFTSQIKFIRAVRYAPAFDTNGTPPGSAAISEVCINNLRKIRFAKELWISGRATNEFWPAADGTDVPVVSDIRMLMDKIYCPLAADLSSDDAEVSFEASYYQSAINNYPSCVIQSSDHRLEEPPESYY